MIHSVIKDACMKAFLESHTCVKRMFFSSKYMILKGTYSFLTLKQIIWSIRKGLTILELLPIMAFSVKQKNHVESNSLSDIQVDFFFC